MNRRRERRRARIFKLEIFRSVTSLRTGRRKAKPKPELIRCHVLGGDDSQDKLEIQLEVEALFLVSPGLGSWNPDVQSSGSSRAR
jgi:hypothetical protein